MKRVYSASDVMLVSRLKNALEEKGIECILKNADLHGGIKTRSGYSAKPELWIMDDGQMVLANRLLDNVLVKALAQAEPWRCVNCGQELENQFSDCWNCGAANEQVTLLDDSD